MGTEFDAERAALARLLGAHLRHELDLGNPYLPRAVAPARAASAPAEPARAEERAARLRVLAQEASVCTRCRLHEGRNKSVFARGNRTASLMFIGEGPGYHEDQQGLPFVGRAGQLLDKMIAAMGLSQASARAR